MYIRHIDHRSGAPWGPQLREGGKKKFAAKPRNFFPGKGAPWGGPLGDPELLGFVRELSSFYKFL